MFLTVHEVQAATDVFPLRFQEIQDDSIVLYGLDVFANVQVQAAHRRLRIEQELRDAQIRLRRAAMDAAGSEDALATSVLRKAHQVRAAIRALLSLQGLEVESSLRPVLEAAGRHYGLDTGVILQARERPGQAYEALAQLLLRAVADADVQEVG